MEEQNNKKPDGQYPWCPRWYHAHGHWHPGIILLRILIAIIIVVGAFAVGVKLGELKAGMYYSGYGGYGYSPMQYMMGGWGGSDNNSYGPGYNYNYNYGPYGAPPMMRYYYGYGAPVPATQQAPQAAPAPTSTGK